MNIAIVGGGASGLTAAIAAARGNPSARVVIYEQNTRVGKKILLTGNGRCNLTNVRIETARYHGANSGFISRVLTHLSLPDTLRFFADIGVPAREEDGRMYPASGQASSVLDALRFEAEALGVELVCAAAVDDVQLDGGRLSLFVNGGFRVCDRLIVATGGVAGVGSEKARGGYAMLEKLGHRITHLSPAIVQIRAEPSFARPLSGIRLVAGARAVIAERPVREVTDEILFTDYGLSGPAILHLSRVFSAGRDADMRVELNLAPEMDARALEKELCFRKDRFPARMCDEYLSGLLSKRLGQAVVKHAGLELTRAVATLTVDEIARVRDLILCLPLRVAGVNGFAQAQVTAGGADTAQFDPATLESRLIPGLYACGEILDVDGDCGGFNLQWAWSSGHLAGASAAKEAIA